MYNCWKYATNNISKIACYHKIWYSKSILALLNSLYNGAGHKGVAVLLPGFAIIW